MNLKEALQSLTPEEKVVMKKDLDAAIERKYQSCVVNGRFDYGKMSDLYHAGKW